jgi:hypothetical protein
MSEIELLPGWECFQDASYYDMYCVRIKGDRTFGNGYHLTNKDEAFGLRDLLNTRAPSSHRAGMLDRAAIKALWKEHGGEWHGPIVEHYSIEEQAFYRFVSAIRAAAGDE